MGKTRFLLAVVHDLPEHERIHRIGIESADEQIVLIVR